MRVEYAKLACSVIGVTQPTVRMNDITGGEVQDFEKGHTVRNPHVWDRNCAFQRSNRAAIGRLSGRFPVGAVFDCATRKFNDQTAIRINPRVAVLVRPKGAPPIRFYGEARVVEDAAQREAVYQRVVPEEQARDPEKKGVGVLILVKRIRQGAQSLTR